MFQLANLRNGLAHKANPENAAFFPRFFKTGPGDYGEGDLFLGVTVPTLRIAEKLLTDKHDLIQKAVGWMLREMGKRIDEQLVLNFITQHYANISRTTLRYAIEKFNPDKRRKLLSGKFH